MKEGRGGGGGKEEKRREEKRESGKYSSDKIPNLS